MENRLDCFEKSDDENLYIIHNDLIKLFKYFKNCFKYIEAAGGVVTRTDGRILLIKRFGKWDLPKGKVIKGESFQEAALREVVEECGLEKEPKITNELTFHTYHTYQHNSKKILKHTVWYTMHYDGNETLNPQIEEDITLAVWFPPNLLKTVHQNTYSSIIPLLNIE